MKLGLLFFELKSVLFNVCLYVIASQQAIIFHIKSATI